MSSPSQPPSRISMPILLLKSPSPTPSLDPYTTHLTTPSPSSPSTNTYTYSPHYIPVLTHTLLPDPLITILRTHSSPTDHPPSFPYGALILTSQRAVAAFTTALSSPPLLPHLPALSSLQLKLYVVGPATERSILPTRDKYLPLCTIHGGEKAGSGEILAGMILGRISNNTEADAADTYTTTSSSSSSKPAKFPILFLTGQKRRDIIPTTLSSPSLSSSERIIIDEMIVYSTAELEEFEFGFARVLRQTEPGMGGVRWVVVFSPTAGRGMLRALGWLRGDGGEEDGGGCGRVDMRVVNGEGEGKGRKTFVACIGPTTRDYLEGEFGFQADVVAEKPSPKGVRDGIERFMRETGWDTAP